MWPFKSKYEKLTKEEVVNAIVSLEEEEQKIEDGIIADQKQIDDLLAKGRVEKDKQIKLLYAKKINSLKTGREEKAQRAMYLIYNVQLLQKLKTAIDNNQFFEKSANMSLGNLLKDQKGLAKFLNKTLGNRISAEDVLTSADETFKSIEDAYEANDAIYGKNDNDDSLLAMFETEEQIADEQEIFGEHKEEDADASDESDEKGE